MVEALLLLQEAIGSNLMMAPETFSQLAHNIHTLAELDTIPGNTYHYARPLTSEDKGDFLLNSGASTENDLPGIFQALSRLLYMIRLPLKGRITAIWDQINSSSLPIFLVWHCPSCALFSALAVLQRARESLQGRRNT